MHIASLLLFTANLSTAAEPKPAEWKAGVAVQIITPEQPMWMAGYGNRNKPAEGKLTDLYVKVLALEDPHGGRLVLLTSDLVGIPRSLSEPVAEEVRKRTGLPRERLMLTVSHTHCGPVLRDSLHTMYDMSPDEATKIGPYTDKLKNWMIDTIIRALDDLKPARLSYGKGTARFAVNRRKPTDKGFINAANPEGPVDHAVPVLRVAAPDGRLRAVVFGYACHNTTLQFYQWCGDYAGFAQKYIEDKHPGATAMFWMGCGADANPLPRSTVELCKKYGRELADAVEDSLTGKLNPITGDSAAKYTTIALPFDKLPSRAQWESERRSREHSVRNRAEHYLKLLDRGEKIDDQYRYYPVQAWRLGGLTWIALGGEVVVDYSLRLQRELGRDHPLWIAGYANDVMAYIPSLRVLKEGGYEGDTSMIPYGMPSKWGPEIEEKIVARVRELVKEVSAKTQASP
ncbi:MAG TPA: neutral/alkaline non-lysosomal ceramidase N-terminal domain-containing protein [Candidatus Binataceae bacterium]|nr:neutral/alkaline non-lysosomal ceramidase N-terminal domain-containing protein [Candidatus Binataceae bacterium]